MSPLRVGLIALGLWLTAAALEAAPRYFVPTWLRPGSINELYLWDEAPPGPFRVVVRRVPSGRVVLEAPGFAVDRPLRVLGARGQPLRWAAALVCPDALDEPGPVTVVFEDRGGRALAQFASEIRPRAFPVEEIPLDGSMSALRSRPDPRKDREARQIWALYLRVRPEAAWTGDRFALPVPPGTRTSAQFGDGRHYLYSDGTSARDYHRGTDFAVPVGTPVLAPAPGTVALVADRMLTGTTVVLEHAPGVYSVYFHLSRALVAPGQKVAPGQRLALSGATGLVTGPHLHWEVRVGGVSVDPLDLVVDGLLDTGAVSAVISCVERPNNERPIH